MSDHSDYTPGPADVARVQKDGENWTLVLVRRLRHSPEKVWQALIEPEQIRQWAPFDTDAPLGSAGATVRLTTVGAANLYVSETVVIRADAPRLLQYNWGDREMRWELERLSGGTRLTLWTSIDRQYIAMGAAGWHICLDVFDRFLEGAPIGRIVGTEALKFAGWQRLHAEYARQFGTKE